MTSLDDFEDSDDRRGSDQCVVSSVHGAYHALMGKLEGQTRLHGLDASEALVLVTLLTDPAIAPWRIRASLGFHRSTMASILDRLERDGHVTRRNASWDGRRYEVDLTTSGRIAADLAAFEIGELEEELAAYTTSAERRCARSLRDASIAITRRDRGSV